MYKCSACNYESYYKVNVEKHINRKNKCSNDKLEIHKICTIIDCDYCKLKFSSMANKNRHLKTCNERSKSMRIKKLEEENDNLRRLTHQNVVNNTTNNTTNNTINIQKTQPKWLCFLYLTS